MSLILRLQSLCCFNIGARNLVKFDRRKLSTTATNALQVRQGNVTASAEQKFRRADEVPANYQLIYRAPMEYYMKWAKNVSSISAGLIVAMAVHKWMFNLKLIPQTFDLNLNNLVIHDSDIWWFAGGFIAINLAMRLFVSKYPLRIYRNEEKYLVVYDSQIPLRTMKHNFARGDVATIQQFFNPWSHCMFRLGNRTSLLLIDYFKTPSELNQMLGLK